MPTTISFQWQPNGKILVFILVFLPLTLGLGFWQLDRAAEKSQILAQQEAKIQLAPLHNQQLLSTPDLHLRQFDLRVEFDPERWFLLDNRVRNGQPGYEVLNLARLADTDKLVLVNRGWVAASLDRNQLPDIETPAEEIAISGYIYAPGESYFALGEQPWSGGWPERIQNPDTAVIGERLVDGDNLLPIQLRLAADDPLAFVAEWPLVNQSPQKHIGYAVQWFVMSLALVILGVFANSNLSRLFATKRD